MGAWLESPVEWKWRAAVKFLILRLYAKRQITCGLLPNLV
jgi:hypothetical protein